MVLVDLFSGLSKVIKLTGKTDIDSPICKLHHNFTTTILLCFCAIVTATNLIGSPISCTHGDHPLLKDDFINTYCWIHTTYGIPRIFKASGMNFGHANKNEEIMFYAYYQWVPFVLFLLALLYYIPYWLWKMWEGGKVKAVAADFTSPIMSRESRKEKIVLVVDYLHASLRRNNLYAMKYLLCEVLNLIITSNSIWFTNKLLYGKFISYGTEVFSFLRQEIESRTDPMALLFPRMTKCNFYASGSSGTLQRFDILCALPCNIINEKIFLFLWVWVWFLLVADCLAIAWRCLVFFVPIIRLHLLKLYSMGFNDHEMKTLKANLRMGDYFFFYLLHKNVPELIFTDMMRELVIRLSDKVADNIELVDRGNRRPHPMTPKSYYLINA